MTVSLAVSLAIFAVIALREFLPPAVKIWHVMTAGAAAMLASGQIPPAEALAAVDWNIILYLFGVFSIGRALYEDGIAHRIAGRLAAFRSPRAALAAFVCGFGAVAALLTNDAAAIIGTPIAFVLARRTGADTRPFLIALCMAVTIGSMATPIGNPQNLLIAASGQVPAPVVTFLLWLLVPTLLSLGLAIWWLSRGLSRPERPAGPAAAAGGPAATDGGPVAPDAPPPQGRRLWPSLLAAALLATLVVGESLVSAVDPALGFPLGYAAAFACLPVFLFGGARLGTLLRLDWATLLFFVAMFVVTGALVRSGALQGMLGEARVLLTLPAATAAIGFLGSQVFSNVPLVDMYLKMLPDFSVPNLMMLAAISTLAGNVFIISAASNVIVLHMAERLGGPAIGFGRFTRAVLPVGLASSTLTAGWVLLLDALG